MLFDDGEDLPLVGDPFEGAAAAGLERDAPVESGSRGGKIQLRFTYGSRGVNSVSMLGVVQAEVEMGVGPYDAFISYSHAADGRLAPELQRGLTRLAKPWYRRHALNIFRDDTGLAVTPELWGSIARALDNSSFLILLASREAAASDWVGREVQHWLATKGLDTILPVVTAGEWAWDAEAGDFDQDSTAVPSALRGAYPNEPRHLDFRWAHAEHLTLRDGRFRNAVAELAAPIRHVPKEDLESEDLRLHRRAIRLARAAVTALAALTIAAVVSAVFAVANAHQSEQRREEGLARELAAQSVNLAGRDLRRAFAVAASGVSVRSTQQTQQALLQVLQSAPRIKQFRDYPASTTPVSGAFSPDGRTYYVAGATHRGTGGVTLFRSDVSKPIAVGSPYGLIESVQWLPGGRLLLISSTGLAVSDGRHNATRLVGRAPGSPVALSSRALAFFPDPETVAVLDLETVRVAYRGDLGSVPRARRVSLSPDGLLAAVPTARGDVAVVDVATGAAPSIVPALSPAAVTPLTGAAAIASEGNQLSFFPRNAATPAWSLPIGSPVLVTALSPDGSALGVRTQGETIVADTTSGGVRWRAANPQAASRPLGFQPTLRLSFSANGRTLVEDGPEGASLRDAATGTPLWSDPNAELTTDGIEPGRRFAMASSEGIQVASSTTLLDLNQGTVDRTIPAGTVHAAWRGDAHQALSAGARAAFLWDLTNPAAGPEQLTGAPVNGGAFDPAGVGFITFGQGSVAEWFGGPAATPAEVQTLPAGTEDADATSGVSLVLATKRSGAVLHVVSSHGDVRASFPAPPGNILPRVLPGARRALFDLGPGVALADLSRDRVVLSGSVCGTTNLLALAVSANGRYLASVGTRRGLRELLVCDAMSGRVRATVRTPDLLLSDPSRSVFGQIAISGDGRRVAFASRDDRVVVADTRTSHVVSVLVLRQRAVLFEGLTGPANLALEVSFSTGDRFLVAGTGREVDVLDLRGGRAVRVSVPTVGSGVYPTAVAVDPSGQFGFMERTSSGTDRSQTEWVLVNSGTGDYLGILNHGTLAVEATRSAVFDGHSRLHLYLPRPAPVMVRYPVAVNDLRHLACGIAAGPLSPAAWRVLLPQTNYVNGCQG